MMKRTFIRGLFSVVAALFALSAAAAGKVEVTGDTSHGMVTSEVNGAVVALTVTPADGYFIRKSDIKVSKTFMPTSAFSRGAGIPIDDNLTLAGNDPDDLSQPRTYTVTMPGEEYDLLVEVSYTSRQAITERMVTLSETVFVYNEMEQRPAVFVSGLTEGKDYTLTYSNPNSRATGEYTVTVKGCSGWSGTITRTYKIFAGGKAEVNNSITGGTIATAVDGLTVTLTVTPDDGYYIRKQDVVVAKTYMPVAASRRSVPIADQLTLTGEDPDDLSLPRTYTTQLPDWEYSTYTNATFTKRQVITDAMVNLSTTSFVFNGSDQKPMVTVTGLTEGKDYLLVFAGTSWSDVGTYSLTVTGRSTWKSVVTKTYTITKASSVVTLVPEPQALTYTGAPQTLIASGDATGGTLLYSLDGSTYQTTLPTGTAAGSYTVYYKVQGDSNHKDTEAQTVTATIAKKAITISGIIAQNKVYDGTTAATLAYDAVIYGGIVDGDNLTVTAKGTFADANVGADKQVAINGLELGGQSIANYLLAAEGHQTLATASITPKGIEHATIADIPSAIYTGEPITPEVDVTLDGVRLVNGTDFSVSYADNVHVGTATVTVTGQGNYQGTATQTFQITKAGATVIAAPKPLELTYTGDEKALVEAGEAMGGIMLYSLDGEQFSAEIPTSTTAGSYTVYYKVQGDSNHSDTEPASVIVTIGPKEVLQPTILLTTTDYTYDGTAKEPTVTVRDGETVIPDTEYTVGYESNVDAGEAKVIIVDMKGGNYTVNGEATFVITKAPSAVMKAPQARELYYTGTAQTLADGGEASGGLMVYSLSEEGPFEESIPMGTETGDYTLYYKVKGDKNHVDSEVGSISVTIAPKALDQIVIELNEQSFVYDGTAKEPAVTVRDGETIISDTEYTVGYESNVDAGEAKVIITDVEGGHYTVNGVKVFVIDKATLNVIADSKTVEWGQHLPELTLRCKGFVNDETEDVLIQKPVVSTDAKDDSEPGRYDIVPSGGEARNYDFAYVYGTLTIYTPQVLTDDEGNELVASVTVEDEESHVVITGLTDDMLNGQADIPTELKDENGDVWQVTEVAAEAFENMKPSSIVSLPEGMNTTAPVTNVINGDGTCETLDLTSVEEFEANKDLQIESVVYEREVTEEAMTVCLPYDIDVPEGMEVYMMNGTVGEALNFTSYDGDKLDAYQPYLMRPANASLARRIEKGQPDKVNLGAKNVRITQTQEDVAIVSGYYSLCGTVRGMSHAEGYEKKAYVMQPDNSWKMTASGVPEDADKQYLPPFRAYLLYTGGGESPEIPNIFDDSQTTDIQVHTVENNNSVQQDGWYGLDGSRRDMKPARRGIWIHQGKKIIIR